MKNAGRDQASTEPGGRLHDQEAERTAVPEAGCTEAVQGGSLSSSAGLRDQTISAPVEASPVALGPPRLFIGQAGLAGAIESYARNFDLLELTAEEGVLPRRSRLRRWRASVPEQFWFSLRLRCSRVCLEDRNEAERSLRFVLATKEVLKPRWLVVSTSAEVTPSARTRRRLEALFERLPRDGCQIGWEPHGLWEKWQEEQLARALDLVLIRDLRRRPAPPGEVIYTRLMALGSGVRQAESSLLRLAEQISGRSEAWVVVEGRGAGRVRDFLQQQVP